MESRNKQEAEVVEVAGSGRRAQRLVQMSSYRSWHNSRVKRCQPARLIMPGQPQHNFC